MIYLFRQLLILYYQNILSSYSSALKSGKCCSYTYYCCCLFVLRNCYFSPFFYRKLAGKLASYLLDSSLS